jgi:hypothetical protein
MRSTQPDPEQKLGLPASEQTQLPDWQICPGPQDTPHAPQFSGSFWVSTHSLPQSVGKLAAQWQLPLEHTRLEPQALPQAPQ